MLGVPLLLALRPAEVIALLGHELGHLKYADVRRGTLTAPARHSFGRLSRLIRPPAVSPWELGPSIQLAGLLIWQLTAGVVSWLLFAVHLAINRPALTEYVQHHVPKGEAAVRWRRMLRTVRDRERAPAVRRSPAPNHAESHRPRLNRPA